MRFRSHTIVAGGPAELCGPPAFTIFDLAVPYRGLVSVGIDQLVDDGVPRAGDGADDAVVDQAVNNPADRRTRQLKLSGYRVAGHSLEEVGQHETLVFGELPVGHSDTPSAYLAEVVTNRFSRVPRELVPHTPAKTAKW